MKKHLLFAFLGALACYSCSNSYDLLENDAERDTAKIETVADEQVI